MLISGFVIRLFSCSLVAFGNRPIIPARLPWRCKQVENVNPPPQNFLFLAAYRVICIRPKVRLLLLFFNDVMSWKLEPSLLCFSLLHSSYIVQQQIYKKKINFPFSQDQQITLHIMHHTVRNLHFLSKNSTLISRENCRFLFG